MQLYMSKKARANNIRMEFFIYEEVQLEKEKPKKLFTPAKKILPMKTQPKKEVIPDTNKENDDGNS